MVRKDFSGHTPKGAALAEIQRHLDRRDTLATVSRKWAGEDFSLLPYGTDVFLTNFQLELYPYNPFGTGDGNDALLFSPKVTSVLDLSVYNQTTFEPDASGVNYGVGACNADSMYFDFSCVGLWVIDMSKLPIEEVEGVPVVEYAHNLRLDAGTFITLRLAGYNSHEPEFTAPSRRRTLLCTVIDDTHISVDNYDLATLREYFSTGRHKLMNSWPILRNGGGRNLTGDYYSFVFSMDVGSPYIHRHAYSDD